MSSSPEFDIPDNIKYVKEGPFYYDDGAFLIWKTRWGTNQSSDKDGNQLCSGMDKEAVEFWSREHLNGFQNSYCTQSRGGPGGDML